MKRTASKPASKTRTVLVILSNRLDYFAKKRFLEIQCDDEGSILKETKLKAEPKEPTYDEVWENDEGKNNFGSCHSFKRKYGHKLQKK